MSNFLMKRSPAFHLFAALVPQWRKTLLEIITAAAPRMSAYVKARRNSEANG